MHLPGKCDSVAAWHANVAYDSRRFEFCDQPDRSTTVVCFADNLEILLFENGPEARSK
jgi:hypothetical protein